MKGRVRVAELQVGERLASLETEVRLTREAVQNTNNLLASLNIQFIPRLENVQMFDTRDKEIKTVKDSVKEIKESQKWAWRAIAVGAVGSVFQLGVWLITRK